MRAKFYVTKVVKSTSSIITQELVYKPGEAKPTLSEKGEQQVHGETLTMAPVCPSKFGPSGEHEDNDFHRWSPSGSLELHITNSELFGKFVPGEKYYLDFSKAEK